MPYYLLILLLLSVNFFNVVGIGQVFSSNMQFIVYIMWLIVGAIFFRKQRLLVSWQSSNNKYTKWYLLGCLLSFIPAYVYYGQSITQSIITYRFFLYILTFPLLLTIRPTLNDFKKAIFIYSVVYLTVVLIDAQTHHFIIREESPLFEGRELNVIDEGDFIHFTPGFYIIAIGLFVALQDLRIRYSVKNMFVSVLYMAIIFLVQNRGTLFPCILIFIHALLTVTEKRMKKISIGLSVVLIAILGIQAYSAIERLMEETIIQVSDSDYNRNVALVYYLTQANPGWLAYLFGNGFLSAHAAWDRMIMLRDLGAYASDIGLVGLWSVIGLLPVFAILVPSIKGIHKQNPIFVRYISFFVLSGVVTQSYFVSGLQLMSLSFVLYFLTCFSNEQETFTGVAKN